MRTKQGERLYGSNTAVMFSAETCERHHLKVHFIKQEDVGCVAVRAFHMSEVGLVQHVCKHHKN